MTARGIHLFPFRTEKLSPVAPMVLRKRESRESPPNEESYSNESDSLFLCYREDSGYSIYSAYSGGGEIFYSEIY